MPIAELFFNAIALHNSECSDNFLSRPLACASFFLLKLMQETYMTIDENKILTEFLFYKIGA